MVSTEGLLIPPKTPRKQRNQREKLHPAEDHHEHEYPFGEGREGDIRKAESYLSHARAHVAQGGNRGTDGHVEIGTREE